MGFQSYCVEFRLFRVVFGVCGFLVFFMHVSLRRLCVCFLMGLYCFVFAVGINTDVCGFFFFQLDKVSSLLDQLAVLCFFIFYDDSISIG